MKVARYTPLNHAVPMARRLLKDVDGTQSVQWVRDFLNWDAEEIGRP